MNVRIQGVSQRRRGCTRSDGYYWRSSKKKDWMLYGYDDYGRFFAKKLSTRAEVLYWKWKKRKQVAENPL